MHLLGVSIGSARPFANQTGATAIDKRPQAGSVRIENLGPAGDTVCDTKHHGGPDQAVYCYFEDDYAFWRLELGRDLPPGSFGENLTISGIEGTTVAVGDRFTIGEVVLEVAAHRTPCNTFARHMGDRTWVKRYHDAGRPGAYCRVVTEGEVAAGMPVAYRPYAGERVTVSELMSLDGVRHIPEPTLRRVLATPVAERVHAKLSARLAG